jgi:hypothetical protein
MSYDVSITHTKTEDVTDVHVVNNLGEADSFLQSLAPDALVSITVTKHVEVPPAA